MDTFTIQDAPLNMAPTGIATFAKELKKFFSKYLSRKLFYARIQSF